ncbi:MAG: ATP-dependent DNA helicase, partial [Dolichospermum sp.]
QVELIREAKVQLTHQLFQHPENPYHCYLISQSEIEILQGLYLSLEPNHLPEPWRNFWQKIPNLQDSCLGSTSDFPLFWATIARRQGLFSLYYAPIELSKIITPIWQRQPVVFIGSALEPETEAPLFRQRVGLEDVTCFKFAADSQGEAIQLYVPYKLPLPNTPEFQGALIHQVRTLVCLSATAP